MRGGVRAVGSSLRAASPGWKQRKESGVFAAVFKGGKKQVGLFCLCSLLLWHSWDNRRKPWSGRLVAAGRGGQGVPGATSFHPHLFPLCLSALLGVVLGTDSRWLPLEQGGREKREAKEKRGEGNLACLSGAHGAQGMCRGSSRESGPTSFQTRLFMIKKQLAFLFVLCHPGRWEGRKGNGKN